MKFAELKLISNLQYDATSAILAAGLSLPIPSNSNSTYCSKLVYDILRDANIYIPGIDTDNPSPSLVWRAAKKWEITGDGI